MATLPEPLQRQEMEKQSIRNSPGPRNAEENVTENKPLTGFKDNRPESIAQRKLQQGANESPQITQLKAMETGANSAGRLKEESNSEDSAKIVRSGYLFRGMQAATPNANAPLLGNTAGYQLGVRNEEGIDNEKGFVNPKSGGTSTAQKRGFIPSFTISKHFPEGSHNTTQKDNQAFRWIWQLEANQLPKELVARNDHGDHVSIEPAVGEELSREAFQSAVQKTQANWQRVND